MTVNITKWILFAFILLTCGCFRGSGELFEKNRELEKEIAQYKKSVSLLSKDLETAVANYTTVKSDMESLLEDHGRVLKMIKKKNEEINRLECKCESLEKQLEEARGN